MIAGRRPDSLRQRGGYISRQGFRIVARKGERDGVQGYYVWAEKRP
jgi:ribosomal protein S14